MVKKKAAPKNEQVGARLTRAQRFELDEIAKLKNVGPSELVRLYVLQGIGADREAMETAGTVLPSTRPTFGTQRITGGMKVTTMEVDFDGIIQERLEKKRKEAKAKQSD